MTIASKQKSTGKMKIDEVVLNHNRNLQQTIFDIAYCITHLYHLIYTCKNVHFSFKMHPEKYTSLFRHFTVLKIGIKSNGCIVLLRLFIRTCTRDTKHLHG